MKNMKTIVAACVGAFVASAPANATVIDFAGYKAGTQIAGPLDIQGASFQSSTGVLLIDNFGGGNAICAYNGFACTGTLSIGFAPGASGLTFSYSGDDVVDSTILYQGQSPVLGFTGRSLADGDPTTVDKQFIRFEGVDFIAFSSTDPGGVGFNGFSFNLPAVPEPATWSMLILGFGATGVALRRRQRIMPATVAA